VTVSVERGAPVEPGVDVPITVVVTVTVTVVVLVSALFPPPAQPERIAADAHMMATSTRIAFLPSSVRHFKLWIPLERLNSQCRETQEPVGRREIRVIETG
jgi:hypothetical protein